MLKKVISVALVFGAITFLSAGDNTRSINETSEVFIGLEVGATFVQGDSVLDLNHEGSGASIGFRLGAQNEQWRSMLIFDYFDSEDDDQNYERTMIQVDYYIMPSNFTTVAFRPYIGINGGYLNYESSIVDESGFTFGAQVGFTADVSNSVDLDIAYRYSVANPDELDNIGNLIVGINYLY